jgi:hypothetical protein
MGPATTAAIREFQRSAGLQIDGLAGESVRAKLQAAASARSTEWEDKNKPSPDAKPTQGTVSTVPSVPPAPPTSAARSPEPLQSKESLPTGVTLGVLAAICVAGVVFFNRPSARLRREIQRRLANVTDSHDVAPIFASMTTSQLSACLDERQGYFGRQVSQQITDEAIGRSQALYLKDMQNALRLSDNEIVGYAAQIANAEALEAIREGHLPEVVNPPIIQKFGEKTHFACGASLIEERVISRTTVGGSRGVSVRIMKGVSVRMGAYRGQSVANRGLVPVSDGSFCITNQRIAFVGTTKSFSVDRTKVLSIQLYADGLGLAPASGPSRIIRFTDGASVAIAREILNHLLGAMRITQ